jgi:hypothetical protein
MLLSVKMLPKVFTGTTARQPYILSLFIIKKNKLVLLITSITLSFLTVPNMMMDGLLVVEYKYIRKYKSKIEETRKV